GIQSVSVAKAATATIPIVCVSAGDPMAFGLVSSLIRPSGNITGVNMVTVVVAPKRLELLHQLLPPGAAISMLANPTSPYFEPETRDVLAAARSLGRESSILKASTEGELDAILEQLSQQRRSLRIRGAPSFASQRHTLVTLA